MTRYRLPTQVLKVLAHPTRLHLLNALRDGEECVCHLTAMLNQRQAYISQQLMFLRQADLLEDRKEGARVYYRIQNPRVFDILDAVNALCDKQSIPLTSKQIAACPCPKCGGNGQREGGKRWRSKSLVRVAPTA